MKSLKILTASTALAFGLTTGTPVLADPSSMFILDASGSMWGRLDDGRPKISVAREVLSSVTSKLPVSVNAGLIAYGHRRKGDCSDIELVHPISAAGGAAIGGKLNSLSPRGKTPITEALRLAAEKLTGQEDDRTIVLVSDGIETCEGDPCALAEALQKSDAGLKIHVVGYGVDADAQKQLQCVAEKGGGAYFPANDTSGLVEALSQVTESIATQETIVVEAPEVTEAADTIQLQIAGPGTIQLKLADWVKMPKYWKITNPETADEIAKVTEDSVSAMPGAYQLVWRHLEHGAQEVTLPEVVSVSSGQTTEVAIDTGLQLVPPTGEDKPYYWQLLTNDSDLENSFRKREPAAWYWVWDAVPVPPGDYTLIVRQSEHDHAEVNLGRISLDKGKLTQIALDQGLNLSWNADWDQIYYLKVTDAAGNETKFDGQGPIFLAPGTYDLALRLTEHNHSEADFGTITVSEKGFVDAKLTSGIKFDTQIPGEIKVTAKNLDTGKEASISWSGSSSNRWPPMPLGAGRYQIDMQIKGSAPMTIVPEVSIKPGQFITAKM
ncbi:MAG: VWA domain-containing protein [Roseibium album]|uniref:vWA domain-containing protein n=1 Tax=Roseibium album TaxID=311410 RepID=UPI000D555112|nr:Ca-activated chloride channel family protein [Labrenzia sp. EL_132]MBG6199094.1 Ca-activated chloride channel family protein [Labrenzia sp. EL_13]MBG6228689.1 Ca-activated chloride channel family protein [Labrenzia sp. EL_208]